MRLRPATKDDARALAELIDMAGDGIPMLVWTSMVPAGGDPLSHGEARAAREGHNFSYENAVVVEEGDEIAAMLLAYELAPPPEPSAPLPPLFDALRGLEHHAVGTFYINAIATYPRHRGKGFGRRLMKDAHARARRAGCSELTLIVDENNVDAVRLYQHLGFRITERRTVPPRPPFPGGTWMLMRTPVLP